MDREEIVLISYLNPFDESYIENTEKPKSQWFTNWKKAREEDDIWGWGVDIKYEKTEILEAFNYLRSIENAIKEIKKYDSVTFDILISFEPKKRFLYQIYNLLNNNKELINSEYQQFLLDCNKLDCFWKWKLEEIINDIAKKEDEVSIEIEIKPLSILYKELVYLEKIQQLSIVYLYKKSPNEYHINMFGECVSNELINQPKQDTPAAPQQEKACGTALPIELQSEEAQIWLKKAQDKKFLDAEYKWIGLDQKTNQGAYFAQSFCNKLDIKNWYLVFGNLWDNKGLSQSLSNAIKLTKGFADRCKPIDEFFNEKEA